MSIFRDKLTKPAPAKQSQSQKVTNYDQTWLKINVVGGQSQLCPIKLNCVWIYPHITQRPPQLTCKWFNKTENQINFIDGVGGSYYQPSIADVGTIIHVQCMPELDDAEYEGMPIIKQIGPIKIDPQTQQQANDLLTAKKATFSIKLKEDSNKHYHEGLLKVLDNRLRIVSKLHQQQTQLMNLQIYENNPVTNCTRAKPKQIQVCNTKQGQKQVSSSQKPNKIVFQLASNKIRDVFVLLIKLIGMGRGLQGADTDTQAQPEIQKLENGHDQKVNINQLSQSDTSNIQQKQTIKVEQKQQTQQQNTQKNENQKQHTKQTQKSQSIKDNSKKSQKSQQQLHQQLTNTGKKQPQHSHLVSQIKSSQDLSSTVLTPVIKKGTSKLQQPTPPAPKHNTLQLLQITDLKKQLRTQQAQLLQQKKVLSQKNQTIESLHQQLSRMKERQANLNCNYFRIEDQVTKVRDSLGKSQEELSYYRNQNRILKGENQGLSKKNRGLLDRVGVLESRLAHFGDLDAEVGEQSLQKKESQASSNVQSYTQLKQKYLRQVSLRQQIQAKYQYMKQQAQKSEQKFKQIHDSIERLQNQKNFYKKKYQNTSQQLQIMSNMTPSSPISIKSIKQKTSLNMSKISSKSIEGSPNGRSLGLMREQSYQISGQNQSYLNASQEKINRYQKQVLELKRQLKESVDENNFLRSVNAGSKSKKSSSSKQQLKHQLLQMKKIVNRLTQAVAQKDLVIDHMKKVNKQISQKLIIAHNKIQQISQSSQKQKIIQ